MSQPIRPAGSRGRGGGRSPPRPGSGNGHSSVREREKRYRARSSEPPQFEGFPTQPTSSPTRRGGPSFSVPAASGGPEPTDSSSQFSRSGYRGSGLAQPTSPGRFQRTVSAAMGSSSQGFDVPPIDDQIEYDPAQDPVLKSIRERFRQVEGQYQFPEGTGQGPVHKKIYKNISEGTKYTIEGRTGRKTERQKAALRNPVFQPISLRSRKLHQDQRKRLEPQRGAVTQRPDPYRRSQLERMKQDKKQWMGMEHRRLYQRSPFKLQEQNKRQAERMLALRRAYIQHGITYAPPVSDNHIIKPVTSGIPEGLPKIKEAKPKKPSNYFPPEFIGYPTRPRTPPSWPGRSTHLFESNLPEPYTRTEPPESEYRGSGVARPSRIRQDQEYEEQLRRLQNLRLSSEQNRETGYDTDEDSEFGD